MTRLFLFFIFGLLGSVSFAQESGDGGYDMALLKREYIGKNEIYTLVFKSESGKTIRQDGYIRPSAAENRIHLYSYNRINRNYDILEIPIGAIQSIIKAENQNVLKAEKEPVVTPRSMVQVVTIILVGAALALAIFYKQL